MKKSNKPQDGIKELDQLAMSVFSMAAALNEARNCLEAFATGEAPNPPESARKTVRRVAELKLGG